MELRSTGQRPPHRAINVLSYLPDIASNNLELAPLVQQITSSGHNKENLIGTMTWKVE